MDLTMPARCPKGHVSTDTDYCSECGAKMPAAPSGLDTAGAAPMSSRASAQSVLAAAQSGSDTICPDCGTPRASPTATFCEVCRYNFVTHTSWSTPKVSSQPAAAPSAAPPSVSSVPPPPVFTAMPTSTPASSVTPSAVLDPLASPPVAALSTAAPGNPTPPDPAAIAGSPAPSAASAAPGTDVPVGASGGNDPALTSAPTQPNPQTTGQNPVGLTLAPILSWEAVLAVDPSLNVDPDPALPCPVGEPERIFPLDFADNLIGRRSEKRGIYPEINVNDPCASHRHAKIQRQADGSFALLDIGSTNGTQHNGIEVQPNVLTPLADGDQITLGCWTRITIRGRRS